jgi:hypothetical protein
MKGLLGTVVVVAMVVAAMEAAAMVVAAMVVATKAMVLEGARMPSKKCLLTIEIFEIMNFRT